jgi:DedD protein
VASPDSDLQTDLRKRARRRLLGAIALALTAAIVLPIVMDHEPRPPAQDIAVRIPARDNAPPLSSPARSDVPDTDVTIPPAPPDSDPRATDRVDESAATAARPAAPLTPEPPKSAPVRSEPAKPEPTRSPPVKAEPSKAEAPKPAAPKPDAVAAEAARAAALLEGKSSSFALQLGVFGDVANASKLRKRAKDLGFASFTEDVRLAGGQTQIRVKVGPFSSRAAAEAAQRKLESAGLKSMVTPRP